MFGLETLSPAARFATKECPPRVGEGKGDVARESPGGRGVGEGFGVCDPALESGCEGGCVVGVCDAGGFVATSSSSSSSSCLASTRG